MRTLAVASLVLLANFSAHADAPSAPAPSKPAPPKAQSLSPAALPSTIQQLRDQWAQCTATAAKPGLRSSRSAEAVADAALQGCKPQEQALARALSQQFGTDGAARVLDLVREADRANLVRVIEELRAKL